MAKPKNEKTSIVIGVELDLESADKIKTIIKKFKDTQTAWNSIHEKMRVDVKFFNGIQYDEQWARAARVRGSKVQIQLNVLSQNVQLIENQMRQLDIAAVVHSTDEVGSEENASILEGIYRHIENQSNAKTAYISAYGKNGALVPGIGFVKWNKKYVTPMAFEQELYIEEVKDPFKILPDFFATKSDFSDSEHWFEYEIISKDDFKRQFPEAQLTSFQSWEDRKLHGWVYDNSVQVVKYWYKDIKKRLLIELEDGTIGYADELGYTANLKPTENAPLVNLTHQEQLLDQEANKDKDGKLSADYAHPTHRPMSIKVSRETEETKIKWCLTNGVEILQEGEWDDSEFPFVAFVGTDTYYEGDRMIYGLIRNTHDAQKMLNYMASKFVQKIGATNKSPWIAPLESIPQNLRRDWEKSNDDEKAILYYNEYVNGRQITAPFRGDNVEPAVQALLQGSQMFGEILKKTMGVPDAMMAVLPDNAVQQSGVALHNLTEQGEQINHHYADNMLLSMRRVAELGIRLIPKIYDTARAIRIIGPDGDQELIKINQMFNRKGKPVNYNLGTGSYGVTIDTGPSYTTKKAQTVQQLLEFLKIDPQFFPVLADQVVKNSDWDINGSLEERIKMWQSVNLPWIKQDEQDKIPPAAMVQMSQMQNQHNQLLQLVQKLELENNKMKQEQQADVVNNAAKERLEKIKQIGLLQQKQIELQIVMIQSRDDLIIAGIKEQLTHTRHHQKLAVDALKSHDKRYGTESPDEYTALLTGTE